MARLVEMIPGNFIAQKNMLQMLQRVMEIRSRCHSTPHEVSKVKSPIFTGKTRAETKMNGYRIMNFGAEYSNLNTLELHFHFKLLP
jgi:hypothetical protein